MHVKEISDTLPALTKKLTIDIFVDSAHAKIFETLYTYDISVLYTNTYNFTRFHDLNPI